MSDLKPCPFFVEPYESGSSEPIYVATLRDSETMEAIAPLTVQQSIDMKEMYFAWYIAQQMKIRDDDTVYVPPMPKQ